MSPWWSRPTSDEPTENASAPREEPPAGAAERDSTPLPERALEPSSPPGEEPRSNDGAGAARSRAGRSRGSRRRGSRGVAHNDSSTNERDSAPGDRPSRPVRPEERRGDEGVTVSRSELESLTREIFGSMPRLVTAGGGERKMALFCDLENIALGVRGAESTKFDIDLVLERLLEKGKIIVKKAYADWQRYSEYKKAFHEAAIELIDIPQKYYSGKNSADIKMVVDAMDLSYSKEHLDTFVIMSGDSDFSPLVSKLKENNKYVIGVGVKGSSSSLLIANCDEFLYYEDIWRDAQEAPQLDGLTPQQAEVFSLLVDSIQALTRENKEVLWGSMVKQTMQRKRPSFSEGYYGYRTFSQLLEDAEEQNVVRLRKDERSGTYVVTGFAQRD